MDHKKFPITVYSSLVTSMKPETFNVDVTATARSLMSAYLQKHKMQLIDPNLITIWRIMSDDDSEIDFKINDGISDRLGADDLIISPAQLLGDEFYNYYLSFERGIQIKVVVNIDKSKTSSQLLLISNLATGNLIIKLLQDYMTIMKQPRINLRHKTGILKGNENLVSLIRNSKSNEFCVDLNRSLQYDRDEKQEVLKRLKTEYERRKSESFQGKGDRINNNLTKTLYHDNQQSRQRKLPDLAEVKQDGPLNKYSEDFFRQETHRRSLPLIPLSTDPSPTSSNNELNQVKDDKFQTTKDHPPEPILRTNLLISDQSSSSTTSTFSVSETDSIRDEITFRAPATENLNPSINHQAYPNLFHIVKYCDLFSIELPLANTNHNHFILDLSERLFKDIIGKIVRKPQGPNPILGSGLSAFKVIETANEATKFVVSVVENVGIAKIDVDGCNIYNGDILVDVDGDNVLNKSKDFINQKLRKPQKHNLVIARFKSESNNNKQKDEKINKLKSELEILKAKYSDLHHVTVDNDRVIQQLTRVLKNQEISSPGGSGNRNNDVTIIYNKSSE